MGEYPHFELAHCTEGGFAVDVGPPSVPSPFTLSILSIQDYELAGPTYAYRELSL
jgi:hypothetical protein